MSSSLSPYPDYRDSDLKWLGPIPRHWSSLRTKNVFKEVDQRSLTGLETHLSMSQKYGLVASSKADYQTLKSESYVGGKLCLRDDLVLNRLKAHLGVFAHAKQPGVVSPDYSVFRPQGLNLARYFEAVFKTPSFITELRRSTKGIVEGFWRLYTDDFYNMRVPVPPSHEQTAIVSFLDHSDQKIRRFIQAKRRLIDLLEEEKRATVEKAVTLGLNAYTRLKNSGVQWLGDVPSNWAVASLRFRYDQCLGKMVDAKKATGKHLIPYLRNFDVRWNSINTQNLPLIDIMPHERGRFTVQIGDLLVCEGRHLGRSAFWDGQIEVCGFQKALHRLRPLNPSKDDPRFLYYCLYLAHIKDAFDASSTDNSIPHLTGEMLRAHKFPYPPVEEQTAIATYLDERLSAIKKATTAVQAEISLVLEYRTQLISDVVTGKLDVRDAAGRLPSSSEQEALDDSLGLFALDPEEADGLVNDPELLSVAANEE